MTRDFREERQIPGLHCQVGESLGLPGSGEQPARSGGLMFVGAGRYRVRTPPGFRGTALLPSGLAALRRR